MFLVFPPYHAPISAFIEPSFVGRQLPPLNAVTLGSNSADHHIYKLLIMSTSADRGWMYAVEATDRFLSYTFCSNLDVFLDFAFSNKAFVDNNRIKCPCLECNNKHYKTRNDVMFHLYEKGFTPNYTTWLAHGETSSKIQHEGEYTGPVEDDECARTVVDELGLTNVNYTTNDVTTARIQLKGECYSPIEDDGCTRMVVDEVGTAKVDITKYESNCDSDVLEGTEGCPKNLKVKLSSELFKSKSEVTRRCQKDLKVNLTSELFKSKSKGTRRCQKDLKVNPTSDELFKSKSKNKIIKPQNETKKIMTRKAVLNSRCVSNTDSRLSIFKHPGEKLFEDRRTYKYMYDAMTIAHRYILFNCEEVKPFIRLFDDLTRQQQPYIDEEGFNTYRQNFAEWFKKHVHQGSNDISQDLIEIAQRPKTGAYTYKGYSINGYEFHSQKHSERKVKKLSGLCVRGSVSNGHVHDYYGILEEIIEVEYYSKNRGSGGCVVVLFKCKWFDTPGGVGVKRKGNLVHIDSKVHQGSNDISQDLIEIAQRPKTGAYTYKGYSINGYKFHSQKHSERKVKNLSGVCVRGSVSNGHVHDCYGILDEIIEVEYYSKNCGSGGCVVVLFKCKWFDTPGGVGVKRKDNLVYIDPKTKLLTDNPFVLPSYTEQVFYAPHRSMSKELKDWWHSV
ncbi:hypothetical protein CTI12_AA439720 [Artemisia annua]|uniref:Transposase-associated domain-containing protein n=1 Tax=Artemisia annua TaxID=35608 RepID=A0A2U1LYF3_ARTAN|nr:hypothetical protein CTI12_AA439720 [Artemisia annua]